MSAELEALLDQTRDVLIAGDLPGLAGLAEQVEAFAVSLPQLDRSSAERIHRKAERNARLFQAATRGIKAARQRLEELSTGPSLTTYDALGRRAVLAGPFGQQPKRV